MSGEYLATAAMRWSAGISLPWPRVYVAVSENIHRLAAVATGETTMYRPDLPDFGAYLSWPEAGTDWIHPEDVELVLRLIPSRRVFHRVAYDGLFYQLQYGSVQLRVKPTLWTLLPECDVLPGDQVELLSQFGQLDPGVATVVHVLCNPASDGFVFRLRRGEMTLPQDFTREQFQQLTHRYQLRDGYYNHPAAKFVPPDDIELLNLGEM